MFTFTANSDKLTVQLNALRDALGGDMVDILKDEAKALSKTCTNFIPPFKDSPGRPAGAREAGENAIKRELSNLIGQARPQFLSMVSQKWGLQDVNGFVESSDGGRLLNLKFDHVDPTGQRISEYHQEYRDRRGKVPLRREPKNTWFNRILVSDGMRQPYIDSVIARVGMWKATWAYAAFRLGASGIPAFISRHFGRIAGMAIFNDGGLSNKTAPFIIIGSRWAGNYRMKSGLMTALEVRVRAIKNRVKLIASGYSRDVSRGIRPQRRAAQTKAAEVAL